MSPPENKPQGTVQEYSIRVPKNSKKRHNVMRFNATLQVDFAKWTQVKMERENNARDFRGMDEEMPKFGAGSEFGRDAREEARRKKYGITSRKYKPDDQPWILKAGGRNGKKFKGIREGGVGANASYYVFTHATDGAIDAFPLHEWYNFQPIQRYKPLSAEEAEQEFSRRNRVMNYFSLMVRKRLKNDEEGGEDEAELSEGAKGKKSTKDKDFKISEMDEWMDSADDDDDSESGSDKEKKKSKENSDDEADSAKNKKKGEAVKKKKKRASDDEAFEESDDGDEEGRECEYISDSSESESEFEQYKQVKSVAEEDGLRKLLTSEEEDEDEQNEKKEGEDDDDDDDDNKDKDDREKGSKDQDKKKDKKKKKKQPKKKEVKKSNGKESSSDLSSDSDSDSDAPKDKDAKEMKKSSSAHNSRSPTPNTGESAKRKQTSSPDISQAKKLKLDNFNLAPSTSYIPGSSESGITEEAVRRYLMRKPMTTTELLQKFKSKKTGLTSEQLVNVMTQILKKINPTKQTIKNKMYLSIKAQPH